MSKFQIVKGITDNLSETPYTEGKVYFTYDNAESTNLNIYADIDGTRRKIKNIHILTLQEDENEKLTTGEDDSISNYIRNNELVIIYYMNMPFYLVSFDRGFDFATTDGHYKLRYSNNNHSWIYTDREASFAYQDEIPENISDLNNDSGFQTSTEVNSAIATAIGNINQFNVAIVSTLPTENIDDHTIYFMSNGGSDDSIYDEWMYINNDWEKIGTTAVDLSGYMQTSHPANGITSTDITKWNNIKDEKVKQEYYSYSSGMRPILLGASGNDITETNISYKNLALNYSFDSKCLHTDNLQIGTISQSGYISLGRSILYGTNDGTSYTVTLPAANGTVALTSDIPTIPTTISSFTNDSGYLTLADLPIYDGTVV